MAGRDPQERAKTSDREAAMELIERAHAEGRIGSADRTVRKNNAATAATLGELDMITQDLPGRPPGTDDSRAASASEPVEGPPAPEPDELSPEAWLSRKVVVKRGGGAPVLILLGAVLVAVAVAGSIFLARIGVPEIDLGTDSAAARGDQPAEDRYAMDEEGFAWVIDRYRRSFETTRSWETIFYDGYAIFYAPNDDGSDSREGWVYRDGGFTEFGTARFNPSDEKVTDLRRLDLAGLVRTIDRARTRLGVPDAEVSHIIVSDNPFLEKPSVTVYVRNEIGQSAFLQTDLRGTLLREVPFSG